ncbi:MAG: GNAT family N-acetyltransferase [Thermomicrobiales bacterium]|nr:GNAT family N-acetyltransferase [Thermomicrobiales bacterium]
MIQGILTNLRAIELDDTPLVHAWYNTPAVMDGWGVAVAAVSRTIVAERVAGWIDREREIERPVAFIIERAADSGPLGLFLAMPVGSERRIARISLLIGNPDDWGQGYGGDALDAFLEAAFDGWNLHRIELELEANNPRAARLYESAGFRREAVFRAHRFRAGERTDLAVLGLTADEWRARSSELVERSAAQDPGELFDVLHGDGTPAGYTKPRWQVHRDGDWHRSIHVWICGIDANGAFLDFQRRGSGKDTWPGVLDATVGGHLGAGETVEQAYREIEEEIGVHVEPGDLRHVGTRRGVSERGADKQDREIQEVHFVRRDQPLSVYRPNADELDGIVRIAIADLIDLMTGARSEIGARGVPVNGSAEAEIRLTERDFVSTIDRYYLRVAVAAQRFLAEEVPIVV